MLLCEFDIPTIAQATILLLYSSCHMNCLVRQICEQKNIHFCNTSLLTHDEFPFVEVSISFAKITAQKKSCAKIFCSSYYTGAQWFETGHNFFFIFFVLDINFNLSNDVFEEIIIFFQ
jgi:hypothetical protein